MIKSLKSSIVFIAILSIYSNDCFSDYNINMANIAENNKVVENYILDTIRYTNASQDQVWVAKHKVIKKSYMLKKFKIGKGAVRENQKGGLGNDGNAVCMQKVIRQVDLLKTIQIEGIPKCQKMIKTASNIFLVYDEFVGVSLAELVKTHLKSSELCLEIMLRLAKKLQAFHQQEVIFLQLSPENIFVQNNDQLLFSQWSLSIFKNNSKGVFPINNAAKSQFIAKQVTEESKFLTASDIFSLGKIFSQIIYSNKNNGNDIQFPKDINELVRKMTDRNTENRPTLQKIILVLERANEDLRPSQFSPREKAEKQLAQTEQSENQQGRRKLPSNLTMYAQQRTLTKDLNATRSARNISFDHVLTGMRRAGSQAKILQYVKKGVNTLVLKVSKNRNLVFFIHNLSEFSMKHPKGEYLSFLLLKQSHQILNDCYLELKNQHQKDAKSVTLLQLLKKETTQMNLSLNMMKEYFICGNPEPQMKAQLRNDMEINQRYYRQQIKFFSTEFMQQINTTIRENKVSSLKNLVNDLFSLYMILKRVEEGSFQKYWGKIYSTEYAFLLSQRYFIEEKKLGYRYLKNRISQILNKK